MSELLGRSQGIIEVDGSLKPVANYTTDGKLIPALLLKKEENCKMLESLKKMFQEELDNTKDLDTKTHEMILIIDKDIPLEFYRPILKKMAGLVKNMPSRQEPHLGMFETENGEFVLDLSVNTRGWDGIPIDKSKKYLSDAALADIEKRGFILTEE